MFVFHSALIWDRKKVGAVVGGGFWEADVAEGAAVALGFEGGGREGVGTGERVEVGDGPVCFLAQGGIHGDEGSLLGFGVEDEAFGDGNAEHFFEAEGLGAELDAVIEPLGFFAGFVFDGAGFGDGALGFFDFDDVGFAVEAEGVGPDGECAEEFPTGAVFEAGEVSVFVLDVAAQGVFVCATDPLDHFQCGSAFAVEDVVEKGKREGIGMVKSF